MVDVVLLLTSELVTNAVVHTSSDLELIVRTGPEGVLVEVHDADGEHLPVLRKGRSFDEGGRGLLLVAELAVRWGAERNSSGKCVWFQIGADIDLRAPDSDLYPAAERATVTPPGDPPRRTSTPSPGQHPLWNCGRRGES